MGLPAPPPPPSSAVEDESTYSTTNKPQRRPIPDWQKDPHGWIDYDADGGHDKARVVCVLRNLRNRPQLNGSTGLVIGYEPGRRLYRVQLCHTGGGGGGGGTGATTAVVHVAPDRVRRAGLLAHVVTGRARILWNDAMTIRRDARHWLRPRVPLGTLAGNRGPTDAQLDACLWTLLVTIIVMTVCLVTWGTLCFGFTKTCTTLTWLMTVLMVVGPELSLSTRPGWTRRCHRRWKQLAEDLCGRPLTQTGLLCVTILWCAFTAGVLLSKKKGT